jgi:hypothetical protein
MLKFQLGTKLGSVESLLSISSVLLSFVLLICSAPVFADDYPEGDYLHHLWRQQEESERNQDFFDKGMGYGKYAKTSPNFCAIAWSKATHTWGSAWGKDTQAEAEREALSTCSAPDAEIVCWSKGNWYCALADGPGSGADNGETAAVAEAKALKIAGSPKSRIILLVGGRPARQWYLKDIHTWVESTRHGDIASGPPPGVSDGTSPKPTVPASRPINPLLTMPHPTSRH